MFVENNICGGIGLVATSVFLVSRRATSATYVDSRPGSWVILVDNQGLSVRVGFESKRVQQNGRPKIVRTKYS